MEAPRSRRKRDSSIEMQVSRHRQSSALQRARPPHNNILTYEVSAFFQSHGFSWRPLSFRLPTSRAPAATLGRCSFCCLSRHRYIHKAAQRVYLFLPFSTLFPPFLLRYSLCPSSSRPLPFSFSSSLCFVTEALSHPWFE